MTMKKLLVLLVLSGFALCVLAQNQDSTAYLPKNVVKFLPINLPFQSTSLEYERMINGKNSLTLGVGLPNQKSVIGKYGINGNSDLKTAEFGTMHLRAAFRHYTGHRMLPKGFYLEPYLKYQEITGNAHIAGVEVVQQTNQPYEGDVNLKLHTMNLGLQFGAQFLIAKRIAIDIYFLGLEAGFLSGNVTAVAPASNPEYATVLKSKIDEQISKLPSFIANKLTTSQTGDQVNVNASSIPYPWLRGGVSIGFAF